MTRPIAFPLFSFLLSFDNSYLQVPHCLKRKNVAAREENKMSGKFTKNPFYMLTMESICGWLSSLHSSISDPPFFLSLLHSPAHRSAQSWWPSHSKIHKGMTRVQRLEFLCNVSENQDRVLILIVCENLNMFGLKLIMVRAYFISYYLILL